MTNENSRMHILEMIDNGEITPEEGARRLDEIGRHTEKSESQPDVVTRMEILEKIESGDFSPEEGAERLAEFGHDIDEPVIIEHMHTPRIDPEDTQKWKRWWTIPLWVGIGVTILSGLWMNSTYTASGVGFWFLCAWAPLSVGVMLILLGSLSNSAHWLHVRVKQPGDYPSNVAVSIPLPTRFAAWVLRRVGRFIPGLDKTSVDEIITALDQDISENPLHIFVHDDEDGEQVEVFIG